MGRTPLSVSLTTQRVVLGQTALGLLVTQYNREYAGRGAA